MSISELHQAALDYAADGIPVFPCISNAEGLNLPPKERKKPACLHGFKDATIDVNQINRWWQHDPNFNIATEPELNEWAIVDREGTAPPNWNQGQPTPKTFTVGTPNDGEHLYYKGSIRSSVRFLPGVDTRGKSGYVLLPPSLVSNRPYVVKIDAPLAPLPKWIKEAVVTKDTILKAPTDMQLDLLPNVVRASKYLRSLEHVTIGEGSDDAAFRAAAVMRELGLSGSKAIEVMLEHFPCTPLDVEWVAEKVKNAYNYGQNDPGASAVVPAAENFAEVLPKVQKPTVSRFRFKDAEEMCDTPEQTFIMPGLIPENSIVAVVAAKGSFKTFLGLDIMHSVSTGLVSAFGVKPLLTGPTFYGAHEGRFELEGNQRKAWCLKHGFSAKADQGFYVAPGPQAANPESWEEFRKQIRVRAGKRVPRLIAFDTYAATMTGWNENDPGDVGKYIALQREMLDEWPGCSILNFAHFGKDSERGTRGSSAFEAGVDTVIDITRIEKSLRVQAKVRYHRNAPEPKDPFYMEGKVLGKSLVFQLSSEHEHTEALKRDSLFETKRVHAALTSLRAFGEEKGSTTHVLASTLIPPKPNKTEEDRELELMRGRKLLMKLSRGGLAGYFNQGSQLWHLPEQG